MSSVAFFGRCGANLWQSAIIQLYYFFSFHILSNLFSIRANFLFAHTFEINRHSGTRNTIELLCSNQCDTKINTQKPNAILACVCECVKYFSIFLLFYASMYTIYTLFLRGCKLSLPHHHRRCFFFRHCRLCSNKLFAQTKKKKKTIFVCVEFSSNLSDRVFANGSAVGFKMITILRVTNLWTHFNKCCWYSSFFFAIAFVEITLFCQAAHVRAMISLSIYCRQTSEREK